MSQSVLEQYKNNIQVYQHKLPVSFWFDNYFRSAFCMARVYDGNKCSESMYCFLESMTKIVPNERWRYEFKNFLLMTPEVKRVILNMAELKGFFNVYTFMYKIINENSQQLLSYCLQNNDVMFMYLYIMYCYMLVIINAEGKFVSIPTYNQLRSMYNPNLLTKADWGRPTWFVIHTSALYMSSRISESGFADYIRFLECLRDILPCEICKSHLRENLKFIDFGKCGRDNISLFKCTWELHNIVNRSLNKPDVDFNEALAVYVPDLIRTYH